jgi:hypothetical protein
VALPGGADDALLRAREGVNRIGAAVGSGRQLSG